MNGRRSASSFLWFLTAAASSSTHKDRHRPPKSRASAARTPRDLRQSSSSSPIALWASTQPSPPRTTFPPAFPFAVLPRIRAGHFILKPAPPFLMAILLLIVLPGLTPTAVTRNPSDVLKLKLLPVTRAPSATAAPTPFPSA